MPKLSVLKTFFRNEADPYIYLQSFLGKQLLPITSPLKMWYHWTNHTKSLVFLPGLLALCPQLGMQKCSLFFPNRLNKRDSFSSASKPQPSPLWLQELLGFKYHTGWGYLYFSWNTVAWFLISLKSFSCYLSSFVCWGFCHYYSKLEKTPSCCCEGLFFLLKRLHKKSLHKQAYDFPDYLHSFYQPPWSDISRLDL